MTAPEKAATMFGQGYNCAQSVLAACGEARGLPPELALRVAGPFGGGIARTGATCGAVSGAIMAIGLAYAKAAPGQDAARDKGYDLARQFMQRFAQRNGTTCCRELIGCDISTDEGMAEARRRGVLKTVCPKAVRDAAEIVEELLGQATDEDRTRQVVQEKYAAVAESSLSSRVAGVAAVAQAFGYTPEELARIPAEANMGLSCGNPVAMASLRPGEVVLDLGSGGGLDVFLAAQKVGPTGKAIGVDMTPAMIDRARDAARRGPGGKPYANVEFHLARIDRLPLPDAAVDCVISNCVINLAPDKPAVFREIARVLRPGGRLAVSDIALKQPLPEELAASVAAYVGCIAGAIPIDQYKQDLLAAGFAHVEVIDSGADLNAYAKLENQGACCSAPMAPPPAGSATASPAAATATATTCCAPPAAAPRAAKTSCCAPPPAVSTCCAAPSANEPPSSRPAPDTFARLADLLKRYDVNRFAASVKVFAVKPPQ